MPWKRDEIIFALFWAIAALVAVSPIITLAILEYLLKH
ncbi:MAG: hypothetical protein G01um10148_198 [Parcubacteria group bacterium Gr01-1014_8]|nr:MAG: hypothetical protein G01um10148_198 [Parcubacteria group bacterium Gr01-1014_8]